MMQNQLRVIIKTIENTKLVVAKAEKFKSDIDVRQGRYVVDAKSIMGWFSLDITKPAWLEIKSQDMEELVNFYHEMEVFEIESSDSESRNNAIKEWFRDLKTY